MSLSFVTFVSVCSTPLIKEMSCLLLWNKRYDGFDKYIGLMPKIFFKAIGLKPQIV
jgi:hypothetical protein